MQDPSTAKCRKCSRDLQPDWVACPYCGAKLTPSRAASKKRGNGQGTVYRRGAVWQACVTIGASNADGHPRPIRRYKSGFRTKTEALQYLNQLTSDAEKPPKKTLADYWNVYSTGKMTKLSLTKQSSYRTAYNKLGDIVHRDISKLTVEDLSNELHRVASTFYPARDIKIVFHHLYKLAGADCLANAELPSFLDLPPLEEKEPMPFTEDEIKKIWEAYESGDSFAANMLVMIYSGMMPGELLRLKKDMVYLDTQEIIGAGLKTKVRKRNAIVIADFIVPILEKMVADSTSRVNKVLAMDDKRFYTCYHLFTARIGIRDLPPYSCRHSTATALALGGAVAPSVIQRIMRHAKFSTTEHYIHPDSSAALRGINTLRIPLEEST